MKLKGICFLLVSLWISVSGKALDDGSVETPHAESIPIPDRSQIQLSGKFCFTFNCLSKITDRLEADKV
jgi:hypothetical protein